MPAPPAPAPAWGPADVYGPEAPVAPLFDRPPGLVGDVGSGVLDLTLPSDDALMAGANPNPERARDQVATGNPANLVALAARFARAGVDLDASYGHSQAAQQQLAVAFGNDGGPVYDRDTHFGSLPPDYRDAGVHLEAVATRLATIANELTSTQTTATTTVNDLLAQLDRTRVAWVGEVAAARNPAGLIPYAAIGALTARRATVAAGMQRDVNTAGTTITTAITAYEDHLRSLRALLADTNPAATPFSQIGQVGGEQLRTPIHPGGPLASIFPVDDGLPRLEGGFTPVPGGPEILVNVPGLVGPTATDQGQIPLGLPPVDSGRNDNSGGAGPQGQYPLNVNRPPRGKIEPPNLPAADVLIAQGQRFTGGRLLPVQGGPPGGVLYKQDPQTGQVTNYVLYDGNGFAIKRVDITGRPHGGVPTPHVSYYSDNHAPSGRVYTREINEVRGAVPEEIP